MEVSKMSRGNMSAVHSRLLIGQEYRSLSTSPSVDLTGDGHSALNGTWRDEKLLSSIIYYFLSCVHLLVGQLRMAHFPSSSTS